MGGTKLRLLTKKELEFISVYVYMEVRDEGSYDDVNISVVENIILSLQVT